MCSGNLEGKWVANLHQDRMALTLDLSLAGLGFHNMSLSVPPNFPLPSKQLTAPDAQPLVSLQPREPLVAEESAEIWEASSQSSVVSVGSSPSTAPPLTDIPLTPIPELLHTPTGHSMPGGTPERPSPRASAFLSERRHPQSKIPGPLDSSPILEDLAQGERNVGTIRGVRIFHASRFHPTLIPHGPQTGSARYFPPRMAEPKGYVRWFRVSDHRRRLRGALPRTRGSHARYLAHMAHGTPAVPWNRGRTTLHAGVPAAATAHGRRGAQVVPQATRVHHLCPAVRFSIILRPRIFWLNKRTTQESHAPRASRTTCPRRPRSRI